MEAIILAGGKGTRLRSVVSDLPKCMADIYGRPFLEIQLDYLISYGITRVVLSVGYMKDAIMDYFGHSYQSCEIKYAVEEELLGTGGAVKNALSHCEGKDVLVLNGDSCFQINLKEFIEKFSGSNYDAAMALKPMQHFSRYGRVEVDNSERVVSFQEKQFYENGLINGGIYILDKSKYIAENQERKFSIEKDFFEKKSTSLNILGFSSDSYFIDIGIPKDYLKAQFELGIFNSIDNQWTLFLDRDGVINVLRQGDYVKNLDELVLLPGAIDAIVNLSSIFNRIIVVTNQQGIGKGLMSGDDLKAIHNKLVTEVKNAGGSIDAFYYAPNLVSENSEMRKPKIGMALKAKGDFPEIDFNKSIMIGDSLSDMEFAENSGMNSIFISDEESDKYYSHTSLNSVSKAIVSSLK